ncbi:MAG: ATP-binding cassette domain-containing protein [Sterolibacteriaceae bacterium]|nr:ATP-binding cassette domain-containing protein [Sterolibacteriaceae bacterium]MBK9084490.1 ATP-binding cassette domain-containing protein [Sterolibacteriaceae bacterium]
MIERLSPLAALAPFLRPYRLRILAALVALVVAAGATLTLPIAFRNLIDLGFSAASRGHIDAYFLALFGVALVLALATAARFYSVSWLGERVTADLRAAVYDNVIRMSPEFFESTRTGEVLSRLTSDTTLVETVVGTSFSMGLRNLFLLVGGLVMLGVTSPQLTAYIGGLLVAVVAPLVIFGRRVRKLSRASQDSIADTSALAGEMLGGIATVQAYTHEGIESARYRGAVEKAFATSLRRIHARSLLTVAVISMVFGAVVLVLWLGAQEVLAGRMSGGALGAFVLYAVLVAGALGALAEVWGDLARAAGAMERLLELYRAKPVIVSAPDALPLAQAHGHLRFEHVGFHYPSRPETPALAGVGFEVRPGETVALVGPSGAGKTTVFQLLLRFYDPQSGAILLDGRDIRGLRIDDLRRHIGIVAQDPVIFSADARDNIRYGNPQASEAEVIEAARQAYADEFIGALPQGFDTFLGERGVRLSGGQRQRIAIARALLKNPPLLLLDEATSALDSESERKVQAAIDNAAKNRTVLVIAHRLSTVRKADRIIVLDGGCIEAVGSHDALLAASPLYARLAALQFGTLADAAETVQ